MSHSIIANINDSGSDVPSDATNVTNGSSANATGGNATAATAGFTKSHRHRSPQHIHAAGGGTSVINVSHGGGSMGHQNLRRTISQGSKQSNNLSHGTNATSITRALFENSNRPTGGGNHNNTNNNAAHMNTRATNSRAGTAATFQTTTATSVTLSNQIRNIGDAGRRGLAGGRVSSTDHDGTNHTGGARGFFGGRRHSSSTLGGGSLDAEGNPTKRKKTMRERCFTLPLIGVFAFQIILLSGAFAAIIAVADVTSHETASTLIDGAITSTLWYASSEISNPIKTVESFILEYRTRYHLSGLSENKTFFPCNDGGGAGALSSATRTSIAGSYPFFSDITMAIFTNRLMNFVYVVNRLPSFSLADDAYTSYADIEMDISQCSVSSFGGLYRRYGDNVRAVRNPLSMDEFMRFDDLPAISSIDRHRHEDTHIFSALTAQRIASVPYIKRGTGSFLIYTSPMLYSYVNSSLDPSLSLSARTVTNSETDVQMKLILHLPEVTNLKTLSGIGIAMSMEDMYSIMVDITPANSGGHTSLYILDDDANTAEADPILLATSYLPNAEQYNIAASAFFKAGRSGFAPLDSTYHQAHFETLPANTVRINTVGDTIVSAFMFHLSSSRGNFGVVQATPHEHYYGDVTRLRKIMLSLGICAAVLIIIVCLGMAWSIKRGVADLLDNMALAAAMKNDRTSYIITNVSEIEQLAKGFGRMNKKLLEARAYLPQHLLVTSDDSAEESDEGSVADLDDHVTALSRAHSSTHHTETSSPSNTRGSSNEGGVRRVGVRGGGGGAGGIGTSYNGITVKRVTLLAVNGRGLHSVVNVAAPSTVGEPIANFTEYIADFAHAHKGMIDTFHGDHFVISFNVARANAEGPLKAARCALDISEDALHNRHLWSMGISTGRACVGQMGTSSLKRLSIVGSVYGRALALERLCRRFNPVATNPSVFADYSDGTVVAPIQVLLDGPMAGEVQHSMLLQVLGAAYGAPFTTMGRRAQLSCNGNGRSIGGGADGNGGVSSDTNNNGGTSHTAIFGMEHAVGGGGAALLHNAIAAKQTYEVVYALRQSSFHNATGHHANYNNGGGLANKAEEWLYEMNTSRSTGLQDVNAALIAYINALPVGVFSVPPPSAPSHQSNNSAGAAKTASADPFRRAIARLQETINTIIVQRKLIAASSFDVSKTAGGNNNANSNANTNNTVFDVASKEDDSDDYFAEVLGAVHSGLGTNGSGERLNYPDALARTAVDHAQCIIQNYYRNQAATFSTNNCSSSSNTPSATTSNANQQNITAADPPLLTSTITRLSASVASLVPGDVFAFEPCAAPSGTLFLGV